MPNSPSPKLGYQKLRYRKAKSSTPHGLLSKSLILSHFESEIVLNLNLMK
jgi:hypothetical protein